MSQPDQNFDWKGAVPNVVVFKTSVLEPTAGD